MDSQEFFRFRASLKSLVANLGRARERAVALRLVAGLPVCKRRCLNRVVEQTGFALSEAKWLDSESGTLKALGFERRASK